MEVKVVDASALAALMFDEPEAESVADRLRGAALIAPSLLQFEILNICVTKLRRRPDLRDLILQAFSFQAGLTIEPREVDLPSALVLAQRFGLTGYDASYLWLAQRLNAELVTLDRELARAAASLRPG